MKYKCGNEVKVGDVIERLVTYFDEEIGNVDIVDEVARGGIYVKGKSCCFDNRNYKLIKRKGDDTSVNNLVWKELSLEEVKNVQIGDKLRISGKECAVIDLYDRPFDYGFDVDVEIDGSPTVGDSCVTAMRYKFEKLTEGNPVSRLERDKEYDLKLTGEDIAFLWYCASIASASLPSVRDLYSKLLNKYPQCNLTTSYTACIGVLISNYSGAYNEFLSLFFQPTITEKQKQLQGLQEQYNILGEKIKQLSEEK